jgi:hypothetical protein
MFEGLLEFTPEVGHGAQPGFTSDKKLSPSEEVDARFNTAQFLEELGVEDPEDESGDAARAAFASLIAGTPLSQQKNALASLHTPMAVKQLVGLLTAYDWNFVEQAAELRGYTLAGIMTETKHHDAKVRLKALELMGKVTEIALFTERIEVKQTGSSDEELEKQLREKLEKFMGTALQVPAVEDAIEVPKITAQAEPTKENNETS